MSGHPDIPDRDEMLEDLENLDEEEFEAKYEVGPNEFREQLELEEAVDAGDPITAFEILGSDAASRLARTDLGPLGQLMRNLADEEGDR